MISKDDKIELLADTLGWVNTVRARYGLTALTVLPRGVPDNCEECVVARAIVAGAPLCDGPRTVEVEPGDAYFRVDGEEYELPPRVGEFAEAFDNYEFVELVEAVA